MGYRIGSFNCLNFSAGYNKNSQIFAKIIFEENLDVIALQEIKRREAVEMIKKHLPDYWECCHDSFGSYCVVNDYAYIWNSRRLRECSKDCIPEVFQQIKSNDFIRKPYYGRFTPSGLGGPFFEFRLIDIHLFFGSNSNQDKMRRIGEYEILTNDVYTRINKKRYGDNMPCYTIILGDYNLTSELCNKQNIEHQCIEVVQNQPTTLQTSEDGFSHDYDHFSYDTKRFSSLHAEVSRINSVEKYCDNDFNIHRTTVSDHVPIVIDLSFI